MSRNRLVIFTLLAFISALPCISFAQQFTDPGFEVPSLQPNTWVEPPIGSPWSFSSLHAGIANGAGSWGQGAHSGQQYAFIQSGSNMVGSISQTIPDAEIGCRYEVSFWMATRSGDVGGNSPTPIGIFDNGALVFPFTYPQSFAWAQYHSNAFVPGKRQQALTFTSQVLPGDQSTLIDDVTLVQLPTAIDDLYRTKKGKTLSTAASDGVLANDYGTGSVILVDDTQQGLLTLNNDGSFVYKPDPGFMGYDSFTYYFQGATNRSSIATAYIAVGHFASSLSVSSDSVVGGQTTSATIKMPPPPPNSSQFAVIVSTAPNVATAPHLVKLSPSGLPVHFEIETSGVVATQTVHFLVLHNDSIHGTATITVKPAGLSSVSLSPSEVTGGGSSQGFVQLDGYAPPNGAVVTLSSSDPAVAKVPATMLIPYNTAASKFDITTTAVSSETKVTIKATYAGRTRVVVLRVKP